MEKSNVKAMREALVRVKRLFDGRLMWQPDIRKTHEAVNAALATPPRNCDVGTALEQYKRFDKICSARGLPKDCPLFEKTSPCCSPLCFARWAQMPYEEGSGK